jgi:hypothetical protein
MRLQSRLKIGTEHAGTDPCCPAGAIHLDHAIKVFQIQGQRGRVGVADGGLDTTHHTGSAPEGNHSDVVAACPVEKRSDLALVSWEGHPVRCARNMAHPHAGDVGEALAVAMRQSVVRAVRHDGGQGGWDIAARRAQGVFAGLRLWQCRTESAQSLEQLVHGGRLLVGQAIAHRSPAPESPRRTPGQRACRHYATSLMTMLGRIAV